MLNDPKTTRSCPKQHPNQTEDEYKKEVEQWVKENSVGWESGKEKNDCWEWRGAFAPHSGGARYNNFAAHSFIFRILKGEYQGSLLRSCRNKNCVNPDHAYVAVGKRTRQKMELKEIVERGAVVMKEEGRKQVVEGITGEVTEQLEVIVERAVKKLERDVVEGVVAKLIEVRFDEMVAKAIRSGK